MPENNPLYRKMITAKCVSSATLDSNLNNGRSCRDSTQCVPKRCEEGICSGLGLNERCSDHSDCDAGFICRQNTAWPMTLSALFSTTTMEVAHQTMSACLVHTAGTSRAQMPKQGPENACLFTLSLKEFQWAGNLHRLLR